MEKAIEITVFIGVAIRATEVMVAEGIFREETLIRKLIVKDIQSVILDEISEEALEGTKFES